MTYPALSTGIPKQKGGDKVDIEITLNPVIVPISADDRFCDSDNIIGHF